MIKKHLRTNFPVIATAWKKLSSRTWPPNSIVYYTGNRKEGLTPLNLGKGTSGTDSAVIYLAREWAKAGREVTVYSNCGEHEGNYDGVNYVNYYRFNPHDKFNILIILAHPYMLQLPVTARKVCWDWHDVLGTEKVYPMHKISRFDQIFAKSQYQRSLLPNVADDKFTIVTNGIDENFTQLPESAKEPFKLIYASRYYRGLENMLQYGWPVIKRHLPAAELHIYHGWSRREQKPRHDDWRHKMEHLFRQDGVFEHGRVSQAALIAEKSTSSVHYYACTYPEIDCISVRESASVGCVPVTTDFAAFKEKLYCVKVAGEPDSQETQENIAYRIIDLLKNPSELSTLSKQFRDFVKRETWQEVSKVWLQYFDED